MPKISKQSNVAQSVVKSGDVMSRIRPVQGSKEGHLKFVIFGNPKTGKTRFSTTFPKPLLIIGSEDGTASVTGTKDVKFVQLNSTSEIYELLEQSVAKGDWATVVLDNATKLRDMRIAELWQQRGGAIPDRKPFLYVDKQWKEVWNQAAGDMKDLLRPLLQLPNQMKLNVIVIAQEQNYATEDDAGSSAGLLKPVIGSAIGKSVCQFLHAECDYVCNTFIRPEMVAQKTIGVGGKSKIVQRPSGKLEFCLRVGPHEFYMTGFRQPLGSPPLPDAVPNPDYNKVLKLIRGESL